MGERAAAAREQLPPTFRQSFPSAFNEVLDGLHDLLPSRDQARKRVGAPLRRSRIERRERPGGAPRLDSRWESRRSGRAHSLSADGVPESQDQNRSSRCSSPWYSRNSIALPSFIRQTCTSGNDAETPFVVHSSGIIATHWYRPQRRVAVPPVACTTGGTTTSGRAHLDLARPELGPLGNAYREYAVLEVRLDLVRLELPAQDEGASVLGSLHVRVERFDPRRHVDHHIAFDEQAVPVGLDVEPVLRDARHLRLYRDPVAVLEDIDGRSQHERLLARLRLDFSRLALRDFLSCCHARLHRSSIHCDLPRPRGLATLDRDLEHAVAVLRVDSAGVHVIGQGDDAPELPIEPFLPVVVGRLVDGHFAVPGHSEQVLLDGDIQALRIEARGEEIHVHPLGGGPDVNGRERAPSCGADAGRQRPAAEELVHLALEAPELVEKVYIETAP